MTNLQPLSKEEQKEIRKQINFYDSVQGELVLRALLTIDELEKKLQEVYDAINIDNSLTEHDEFTFMARDGAHALDVQVPALESRQKKLVEALKKYGIHTYDCACLNSASPCNCGLAALREIGEGDLG